MKLSNSPRSFSVAIRDGQINDFLRNIWARQHGFDPVNEYETQEFRCCAYIFAACLILTFAFILPITEWQHWALLVILFIIFSLLFNRARMKCIAVNKFFYSMCFVYAVVKYADDEVEPEDLDEEQIKELLPDGFEQLRKIARNQTDPDSNYAENLLENSWPPLAELGLTELGLVRNAV